eukprot:443029-Amorphochlora_amoeboformis.AAC.1
MAGVLQLPEPAPSSTAPIILGRGQPGFRLGAQAAMGGRPGGPPVAAEQAAVSAECVMKDVRWCDFSCFSFGDYLGEAGWVA